MISRPAFAQQAGSLDATQVASASASALMILFVLAILIESALSVVFNWRLFLEVFAGRGVKTLVAIVVSALAVSTFDLDRQVFEVLLENYGLSVDEADRSFAFILTTLILAGGSAGVNRLFVALGYRQQPPAGLAVQKAPKGLAWIAIRVTRGDAVGPIEVWIQQKKQRTDGSPAELAGVIAPVGFWYRLWSVFLLDRSRFPPTAGYEVKPGHEYGIRIEGRDRDGQKIESDLNRETYCFADGAIIDFHVTL